jgi:hypothetical protein
VDLIERTNQVLIKELTMHNSIHTAHTRKVILKVWEWEPHKIHPTTYEGTSLDEVLIQAVADSPDTKLYPWQFDVRRGFELHVAAIACRTEEEYRKFKREVILEHILMIKHGVEV